MNKPLLVFIALVAGVLGLVVLIGEWDRQRYLRVHCHELRSAFTWWTNRGCPDTLEARQTLTGFRADLIVTQSVIHVDKMDLMMVFAISELDGFTEGGMLLISTNGVIIYKDAEGRASVVSGRD